MSLNLLGTLVLLTAAAGGVGWMGHDFIPAPTMESSDASLVDAVAEAPDLDAIVEAPPVMACINLDPPSVHPDECI